MNKVQIIDNLNSSNLDLNEIIILSGASLVLQGVIKETNDIDLSCTKEYYDKLPWPIKEGAFNVPIKYNNMIEISNNLYYPNDTVIIDSYKCLSLEKCFEIKLRLNREKDKEIINILKELIKK